jgi:chloride channel protein, CIC family
MFLVRAARDVMETEFLLVPTETRLDVFLQRAEHRAGMRHVIVTDGDRITGAVRINTGLRSAVAELGTGITFGDVANRRFTIVRESDVAFDVIIRLWRRNGAMALVLRSDNGRLHVPRAVDIIGVITKEHVADAVAAGIQTYPR